MRRRIARVLIALLVAVVLFVPFSGDLSSIPHTAQSGQPALPAGISQNWWTAAQEQIRRAEYNVTWQDRAYHAPNRAHNLRTYFTADGIEVEPRTGDTKAWRWGMRLRGWGAATLSAAGNRIEYRRAGVTEWYVNDERGLEQGFTVLAAPTSAARTDRLELELEILGTLTPALSTDGQALELTTGGGVQVLRYGDLAVHDARGDSLAARMSLATRPSTHSPLVRITVEAAGAIYPITIDPLTSSPIWTAESNQVAGDFGISVGPAGDVNGDGYSDVIVGARRYDNGEGDEGRAFVYHGAAAGLSLVANWTAESNQANAWFGISVGPAGDVNGDGYSDVIIGAPNYNNGQNFEGRAFVYHGSAAGLSVMSNWTAESNQANASFGISVGPAGDVNGDGYSDVIVGAYNYSNGEAFEGRAFVYHGSATGLNLAANWTAESNQASAFFGISVATAGDVNGDGYGDVIVGASDYANGQASEGRAFGYHGSAAGLSLAANWTAESNQASAEFGTSVATAGDVNGDGYSDVIVGAPFFANGQANEGRAFVYHGAAAGLSLAANWTTESNQVGAFYGMSVATAGDVNGDGYSDVIVGAQLFDNGQSDEGRAFVYQGSPVGLSMTANWTAESNQAGGYFGNWVATAGDVNGDGYSEVIVGAQLFDNGQTNEGRAFVFRGSAAGLSVVATWSAESNQAGAYFGVSVATAGDVNGDGLADVIVGAPNYDNGQADEGRAFVYYGSAAGLNASPGWIAESNQVDARFGRSVATAGDVNGDGYSDVIVGANKYDNGQTDEGRAFVYHGSAGALSLAANWSAEGNQASAEFGYSVATAGDVNGDGYSDVIVAARHYSNGQAGEGRAFVYHGSPAGLSLAANWTAETNQAFAQIISVSTAGDVNRDGFSDVIIGAPLYANGQNNEGRAFAYHGTPAGLTLAANWTAESNVAGSQFGHSVATAGDVNGDGYSDVIVGAPEYANGQVEEGAAFVYRGSVTGLSFSANWTAESNQAGAWFGGSVAAGDVNGDGYSDVIVGSAQYSNGQNDEGRAFVYHGSPAGPTLAAQWTAESNQAGAWFGSSVAAGDVNGDGFSDVIVSAFFYDNGQADEGRAFLYYGNGGRGLTLRPRQRRANNSAPIAHLGKSDSTTSFLLSLLVRTPFGRGRVRLEAEVKPLGTPFNGTGLQVSGWTNTGVGGNNLNQLITGLSAATNYHWRVRIRYHPASIPFQRSSRWLTIPWNGWNEKDLRTP